MFQELGFGSDYSMITYTGVQCDELNAMLFIIITLYILWMQNVKLQDLIF